MTKKSTGPAIACIGGGTGSARLLRGLKKITQNLTAIIAVSDDGGGSGVLRDELGIPPPGDIRNCMQALSNVEPTIAQLMDYRFDSGRLDGQSFGNLFLAAMNGISESFDKAVIKMGEVLSITGRILPVTNDNIYLCAEFEDGSRVRGESKIASAKNERLSRIKRVELSPPDAAALPECVEALEKADIVILGPGSLYTSIIPNLLVDGIAEAIANSDALKIYICNIMTEPGETDGYSISEHIRGIFDHSNAKLFDYCIVNNIQAAWEVMERYAKSGAEPVIVDEDAVEMLGVEMIRAEIADVSGDFFRHEPEKLAREISRLFMKTAPTRIFEA